MEISKYSISIDTSFRDSIKRKLELVNRQIRLVRRERWRNAIKKKRR